MAQEAEGCKWNGAHDEARDSERIRGRRRRAVREFEALVERAPELWMVPHFQRPPLKARGPGKGFAQVTFEHFLRSRGARVVATHLANVATAQCSTMLSQRRSIGRSTIWTGRATRPEIARLYDRKC